MYIHVRVSMQYVCLLLVNNTKHTTYGDVGIATLKAQQNMFKY